VVCQRYCCFEKGRSLCRNEAGLNIVDEEYRPVDPNEFESELLTKSKRWADAHTKSERAANVYWKCLRVAEFAGQWGFVVGAVSMVIFSLANMR
jgi:hypothetical protein